MSKLASLFLCPGIGRVRSRIARLAAAVTLVAFSLSSYARADLVAWYPLDEGAGNTAFDNSGYTNDMYVGGGGWLGSGAFGGSYQVQPGDVIISRIGYAGSLTDLNAVSGNKVSISFWAKPNNENQGAAAFWISDSNGGPGTRIFQTHLEWFDGVTYWDADWTNGTPRLALDLGTVSDALHHYVMTFNGDDGNMRIYKDGSLAGAAIGGTPRGSLPWSSIQNFEIGALSFDSWWPGGQIDDFAIWNEDLTDAKIQQIYRGGVGSTQIPEPSALILGGMACVLGLASRFARRRQG